MTKKYDIISLNNHLYMVDKEADIKIGEYFYNSLRNSVHKVTELSDGKSGKWTKILASTDTTLGLPLLPKVEEESEIKKLLFASWRMGSVGTGDSLEDDEEAFEEWYEDVPELFNLSAKKYTEEDIQSMRNIAKNYFKVKPIEHFGLDVEDLFDHLIASVKTVQSLTPKPIAVEVEMVGRDEIEKETDKIGFLTGKNKEEFLDMIVPQPKTKDNIVVIRRWIYE